MFALKHPQRSGKTVKIGALRDYDPPFAIVNGYISGIVAKQPEQVG
jgi:hypothetical protein